MPLSCTCYIPPLLFATCTGLMLPLEDTNATSLITWVVANKLMLSLPCQLHRRRKHFHLFFFGGGGGGGGERNIHCDTAICAACMNINKVSRVKYWGALAPLAPRFLHLRTVTQKTYICVYYLAYELPCIFNI